MVKRFVGFVLLALSAMALGGPVQARGDGRAGLFAWFDTLGYDAVVSGQFVRLDTMVHSKGKTLYLPSQYGFLVKSGSDFIVLGTDLALHRPGAPGLRGTLQYSDVDFQEWARTAQSKKWDQMDFPYVRGPLTLPATLFVISRACEARGLPVLSRDLYGKAQSTPPRWPSQDGETFAQLLMEDLGDHAIWQALEDLRDLGFTRKDVVDELDRAVRSYPDNANLLQASSVLDGLRPMLAEDDSHAMPNVAKLPASGRIAELIYELRDQTCGESGDTPSRVIPPGTPAARLMKYGYAAVPQLLAALEDERPTRCVVPEWSLASPMEIRDVAKYILEAIAHRSFGAPAWCRGNRDAADEQAAEIEESARGWWAERTRTAQVRPHKRNPSTRKRR
ncbi:MAG TPA: hypothetical protein VMI31_04830 [Fimbriimonadaceae bacterium]|nr:hypothetical protein [Fimbriimonadaceae bacterium]